MIKIIHLLSCLLFFAGLSNGQSLRERVYIKGGSGAWENLMKEMYLYPAFGEGVVHYKDGQQFRRLMNYNRMLATVQFIDEKNDTLAIANESAVAGIRIGDDVFIYAPNCLQAIDNGKVKLLKNVRLSIADVRQVGAYGTKNTTSAIETNNLLYTWMGSYAVDVNEVLLLSRLSTFYIQGPDGDIVPASKKNVLKLFGGNEAVKGFLRTNNINFSNEGDLLTLTKYLSGL